jgi:D-alanyl-D-alanine dipeptidase
MVYKIKRFFPGLLLILILGCKEGGQKQDKPAQPQTRLEVMDSVNLEKEVVKEELPDLNALPDTTFVRLTDYSGDFAYDLRYATENNFLKAQVYECAECYTRVKTAKALLAANEDFMQQGYRILFFDCYRPNSVQYKMWEIVPNPQYVANPVKGSVHNRGGAVDISLVDLNGVELDMGTDFDFFGQRAYHDNLDLPEEVLANRKILKETMEKHGFQSIRTEWWHYNYTAAYRDAVADFRWPCK